jgi:hypothetical protein
LSLSRVSVKFRSFRKERFVSEAQRILWKDIQRRTQLGGSKAVDTANAFGAILEAAGVRWWLSYGALLGLVREGKFLDHDNDIDVMIGENTASDDVRDALQAAGATLITRIFYGDTVTNENYWFRDLYFDLYYGFDHRTKLVDYSRFGGCAFLLPHERQETEYFEANGFRLRVPIDCEAYLERLYGPDWRTPDINWTWYVQQPCLEIWGNPWNLLTCFLRRSIAAHQLRR